MNNSKQFHGIWLVDFEFASLPGAIPEPRCLVALDYNTGKKIRLWANEIEALAEPPYGIDQHSLIVAYYASADIGCHLALGWNSPCHILDLFTEFRNLTNGLTTPCGLGLQGAIAYFGLSSAAVVEKENMRQLSLRGGKYSSNEKQLLLDYCETGVDALARLLPVMLPKINIPLSLLRGRYMKAAAQMEYCGIPIDTVYLDRLQLHWNEIQEQLIAEIDQEYGVFDGRSFKVARFITWLAQQQIQWPVLETGALDLKDDTFRQMAQVYPVLAPLHELRMALSHLCLAELSVGADGRNRCLLSAFRARTGRNQPSNSRFIFGAPTWLRSLIKPKHDTGLAYIDWSQQEFGIAAALSGDPLMQEAYHTGDPYLTFAKQAGAVPDFATKKTHKAEREQFKACVLAVQYGMGAESLAHRINQPVIRAKELLRLHRETYRVFWHWSDTTVDYAMLYGKIWTVFGWTVHVDSNPNPRFLRNFTMQGNGSEMLRLACCMLTEAGIKVCAPAHDAILIEAPLDKLDQAIQQTKDIMAEASAIVLNGFRLNSDTEVTRYPDRYRDERGQKMWQTVMELLERRPLNQVIYGERI